ncbi:hypothetical protein DPMN_159584 [Dreissena polymorpha]|uniref:Uncharacterized protein n=1 Tax=Dreissena polymorpha TaxID=45954 RepID=A0A9D4IRV2_DREPO|nr:hypothetical protein DPMN_159584 [Dreissena polymorpha]
MLGLHHDGEDAVETCVSQYLCVWGFVGPLISEYLPEKIGMALIHCPCFGCIEQRREHHCTVCIFSA